MRGELRHPAGVFAASLVGGYATPGRLNGYTTTDQRLATGGANRPLFPRPLQWLSNANFR
jgi:hypothetical protein